MRLSIIIPVYNVEAYVGQTLESVFNTTARAEDFEVIVVNDGTKDDSMTVAQQFSDRPNLTIIEQENQGLSAARMNGLAVAKGDYVWFVDSDDWLVEDGVGTVLGLLEERKEAEVLMFPVRWTYEDHSKDVLDYLIDEEKVTSGKGVIRDLNLQAWLVQRFVFKRSLTACQQLYFPIGLLHEDEYFGPVLMCITQNVNVLEFPVYNYRIRPDSIKTSRDIRSPYDLVSIHKLLMRYMADNLPEEDWQWFRSYCFGQLAASYIDNRDLFGNKAFKRFSHANGWYVWRQWKEVNPDKALKTKAGRLLLFMAPATRMKIVQGRMTSAQR